MVRIKRKKNFDYRDPITKLLEQEQFANQNKRKVRFILMKQQEEMELAEQLEKERGYCSICHLLNTVLGECPIGH